VYRDWDAFGDDFEGNILYIDSPTSPIAMATNTRSTRGVVPLEELLHPKHLDAKGDPAMAAVKNGRTTGTTAGWMTGLKALVRYYKFINVEFTSRELIVVPYDNKPGRDAFSDGGDLGSIIVEVVAARSLC